MPHHRLLHMRPLATGGAHVATTLGPSPVRRKHLQTSRVVSGQSSRLPSEL